MDLDKIAPALVAAISEIGGVGKDSKNPAFKSKYASLEAVIDAAKPVLSKHGLAALQMPGAMTDHGLSVTTMILHESGQSIQSTLVIPMQKRDPQAAGSAITYACRYSLMAMLGMPPVDDDGEGAMKRDDNPPQKGEPWQEKPVASGQDEITAYCTQFHKQIGLCKNRKDVEEAWKNGATKRGSLHIEPGSDDYERLKGFCKDQIETFPKGDV